MLFTEKYRKKPDTSVAVWTMCKEGRQFAEPFLTANADWDQRRCPVQSWGPARV